MQGNRRRDTQPEMGVRRLLHRAGYRYRVDVRPLPELNRRADIVFRPHKVAVFMDGCYWHGCPDHGTRPRTNASYWGSKIEGNMARDRDTDERLTEAGWTVLRYWEHQDAHEVAAQVMEALKEARRAQ